MKSFIVNEIGLDAGELLYEKSTAKTFLDAPVGTHPGVKGWVVRGYMLALGAGLLAWFLYSLITSAQAIGAGAAVVEHLLAFFILLLAELILLLSAFNGWGKFARFAFRHRLVKNKRHNREGANARALEAEVREADANKPVETALRIYGEYVEVFNQGVKTVLSRALLQTAEYHSVKTFYTFTFVSLGGERVEAEIKIPRADLPRLCKLLGCVVPAEGEAEKPAEWKSKRPLLFIMIVPIVIGVALTVLHCVVLPDMPLVFGLLFMAFGVLLLLSVFSEYAVIGRGILPIAGGLLFMGLPIAVLFTIAQFMEASAVSLLMPFTAVHAVLSVFLGFGPMLIILGFAGLIESIRYGKK